MYIDEVVKYIQGEVALTVPFIGSYKYQFGKFYMNHPRFTDDIANTIYSNEYEKIYNVSKIVEQLQLIYPSYHIFYDDINEIIHVRVIT
jgi:hypothetical protein